MVGGYANYFWHTGFSITDNLTDIRIYEGLLRGGRSVTDAAMRTDYARYWHGYAVVLRPLMIVRMEGRSQPCVRVFPSSGVVGVLL